MKKLLFALLGSGLLYAESDYNLIADRYFSPYAGSEDLIVTHQLIERSSQPLTDLYQTNPALWAKGARAAELFLFWYPLDILTMTVQHEVFGHGYRVRSLPDTEAKVLRYTFNVPPPYGLGGGATHFQYNLQNTTIFEGLAVVTGGVEATAIGANRLRMQWLGKGDINPRQSFLYLHSEHDLTNYATISILSNDDGDMNIYRNFLNRTYSGSHLSSESLAKQALINLLDPFTYYSLYSTYNYIKKGETGPIPMIPLGSYRYLPGARLGLTPFGPEYYLENFLVKDNKPIYFYLRGGKHAGMNTLGLGVENPHQWQIGSLQLGYRVDLWQQPKIDMLDLRFAMSEFLTHPGLHANTPKSRFGASASLIAQKKLWKTGMLFVQCGGKTKGYVPGESLDSSLILRVGITLW